MLSKLLGGETAVNHQFRACHPFRFIRCQKHNAIGNVAPSHLMDTSLFDFAALGDAGEAVPGWLHNREETAAD